jgi:hypothetical protein
LVGTDFHPRHRFYSRFYTRKVHRGTLGAHTWDWEGPPARLGARARLPRGRCFHLLVWLLFRLFVLFPRAGLRSPRRFVCLFVCLFPRGGGWVAPFLRLAAWFVSALAGCISLLCLLAWLFVCVCVCLPVDESFVCLFVCLFTHAHARSHTHTLRRLTHPHTQTTHHTHTHTRARARTRTSTRKHTHTHIKAPTCTRVGASRRHQGHLPF